MLIRYFARSISKLLTHLPLLIEYNIDTILDTLVPLRIHPTQQLPHHLLAALQLLNGLCLGQSHLELTRDGSSLSVILLALFV